MAKRRATTRTEEPLIPEQPEPLPEMGHARIRATKPVRIVDVAWEAFAQWVRGVEESIERRKRRR
jgi:hypothetical protein